MKISEAYVAVTPQLATGTINSLDRVAKDVGEKTGKALSGALQKEVGRQRDANGRFIKKSLDSTEKVAKDAGEKAGKALSDSLQKTVGRQRDANGRFIKKGLEKTEEVAEKAGEEAGKGFTRRMLDQMNRHAGPAFKKYFGFGPKEAQKSGKESGGIFKRAFSGAIAGIGTAIATAGIFDFFRDSITAASDLNETMNKMRTIFKNSAGAIEDWSKDSAKNLGLSQEAALSAVSSFGLMFKQLGFTGKQTVTMSEQVVQLAADLGSFHNLQTDDVLDRISAALRGEYDSLQLLVPTINAARVEQKALELTGKTTTSALTDQDKAMAALQIITESSSDAIGDFAKTSDGLANKTKIATAKIEDLKAKIGKQLQPVMLKIYTVLSEKVLPALSDFIAGLTGGELEEGLDVAGEKAGYAGDAFAAASARTSDWYESGKDLKKVLEDIGEELKGMYDAYESNKTFWNSAGAFVGIAVAARSVVNAFTGVGKILKGGGWVASIATLMSGFIGLAAGIGAVVGALGLFSIGLFSTESFTDKYKNFINGQDWIPDWVKNTMFAVLNAGSAVKNFFQALWQAVEDFWTKIKLIWQILQLKALALKLWFERVFYTAITAVWEGIKNGISSAWEGIKSVFNTIKDWVTKKVPGWFSSMSDKIGGTFKGLKDGIGSTWTKITGGAKSAINGMGKFINNMISAVNKIPAVKLSLLPQPLIGGSKGSSGSSGGGGGGGPASFYAAGGAVYGGPPGVDTVLASGPAGRYMLNNGEHIWTKKEVDKAGGQAAMYALRAKVRRGDPIKMAGGGSVLNPNGYYPGMGRNIGNVPGLTALYRFAGGRGAMTSGYRPGDPLWHGSGLAADFGGFNQDKAAGNLLSYSAYLLELIHQTNSGTYNVTRGRRVRMDAGTNADHHNHLHLAASPTAVEAILGHKVAPGPGGEIVDWVSSIAGKAAKKLLNAAIESLKGVLPQGNGAVPSALRGIGTYIPEKMLAFFDQKAPGGAKFQGTMPRKKGSVYDSGGWLNPGQVGINLSNKPEAVLTGPESEGLKALGAGQLLDKLDEVIAAVDRVAPGVTGGLSGAARTARTRR